ncbi:MAG: ABC transporter ATP-binding protein [Proteobacteria bacterium]|nr:ABC transporter ATP-binding protein [Pseudomonadota bacterium]
MQVAPALSLRNISKSFGSVMANTNLCLEVAKGTIHGILGENGAGKSTAMKILYGMQEPDAGEIWIDGHRRKILSPMDAKALGIGMVHQHFMLSEDQSVLENIVLGHEPSYPELSFLPASLQILNLEAARIRLRQLIQDHGFDVPLDAAVSGLSVGILQRVEILKLLYNQAKILILDEPTAVLNAREVQIFFAQLRILAKAGATILIVTHKLRELLAVTDAISVFRAGQVIATLATKDTDADQLAALMIGKKIEPVRNNRMGVKAEKALLRIHQWPLKPRFSDKNGDQAFNLELFPGEILGLAGVEGNGQNELVELLRHPNLAANVSSEAGLELFGQDARAWNAAEVTAAGLGCIPADRHREAVLLDWTAIQNFLLGYQRQACFRLGPFIRWQTVAEATRKGMKSCDVQPLNPDLELKYFSGGNQQKFVIAREIYHRPKLLIAVHPTRGVDIGAIQLIHKTLLDLRAQGMAVLLISSELDEIIALSDRILVMENYRVTASFSGETCDETALGLAMSGGMG